MCKFENPKENENVLQKYLKKVDQVRDPYCNPKEISIDRIYVYHLCISYLFSIVSGAVMREIEVMHYNKQFIIMIMKHLRKGVSEHG